MTGFATARQSGIISKNCPAGLRSSKTGKRRVIWFGIPTFNTFHAAEFTKDSNIRIASYNIRKAIGLDRKRDPRRILEVISGLGADLVVLQEADRRLGMRRSALPKHLIETETDFDLVPTTNNGVSIGWHGNAILARRGVAYSSVVPLVLPGLEPRGAVLVKVTDPLAITVAAVHLGLTRNFRRRQLQTICENLRDTKDAIIAGDFNEWSTERGLEPLVGNFGIFAPGKSFHAAFPVASLDRFALGKNLSAAAMGVETGKLARQASDHLPVWIDLSRPE